jgi:putative ABC transport system permease protein
MVPIARRNLLAEKFRLAIAIGGIASAVFLIVTVLSLFLGFRSAAGEFSEGFGADLWVVQRGMADLARSGSAVPLEVKEDIASEPGVAAVVASQGRLMRYGSNDGEDTGFFISFESGLATEAAMEALGFDGPPPAGEIIAHDSVASRGETVTLAGRELEVVDTYSGGLPLGSISFINYETASDLFGIPGYTSYLAVFLSDPGAAEAVAGAVGEHGGRLDALTGEQLAEFTGQEVDSFIPIITVLLVIALAVGAAVVSLIIYTATVERARDYAVLKALGASNERLFTVVLSQSFIVGTAGFVLGVPAAIVTGEAVREIVPEFLTSLDWRPVALVLVAVVIMSSIAAYLPTRRIVSIDPAAVFRA